MESLRETLKTSPKPGPQLIHLENGHQDALNISVPGDPKSLAAFTGDDAGLSCQVLTAELVLGKELPGLAWAMPTFQQGSHSSLTLMVRQRVMMNRGRLSAGRQL